MKHCLKQSPTHTPRQQKLVGAQPFILAGVGKQLLDKGVLLARGEGKRKINKPLPCGRL